MNHRGIRDALLLPTAELGPGELRRARCYLAMSMFWSRSWPDGFSCRTRRITTVEVNWNGTRGWGPDRVRFRPDVARRYPRIPHAVLSGFQLDLLTCGAGIDPGQRDCLPVKRRRARQEDALCPRS